MTLSLEEIAQIQSEIDAGADRSAVLSSAALSDEVWQEAKLAWLDAMQEELSQGKSSLLSRYGTAFVQHRATLAREVLPRQAETHVVATTSLEPRKVELPSFRVESDASPHSTFQSQTGPISMVAPSGTPQPFAPLQSPVAGASLKETAAVDLSAIIAAIPFAGADKARQSSAENPAVRTDELGPPSLRAQTAVPFASSTQPAAASTAPVRAESPPLPAPAASEVARSAPKLAEAPPVETAALDFSSIQDQVAQIIAAKGRALPFDAPPNSTPAPIPRPPSPPTKAEPAPARPFARAPLPDFAKHTAFAPSAPQGPAIPFRSASPPGGQPAQTDAPLGWPIDRYAALSVDIAADPAARDRVLVSYGIGLADHGALAAYWGPRLADPSVAAQWKQACEHYRSTRGKRR